MRMARSYRPENPDLPTLDPWRNTTPLPAEQFVFERNPYYHRWTKTACNCLISTGSCSASVSSSLIPAKAGTAKATCRPMGSISLTIPISKMRRSGTGRGKALEEDVGVTPGAGAEPQL